jgi:hypothetical protein
MRLVALTATWVLSKMNIAKIELRRINERKM